MSHPKETLHFLPGAQSELAQMSFISKFLCQRLYIHLKFTSPVSLPADSSGKLWLDENNEKLVTFGGKRRLRGACFGKRLEEI